MKYLLDTHILLWVAAKPENLSKQALTLIETDSNVLYFSSASLWEIVIKQGLGRPDFHADASVLYRGLIDNGYHELLVTSSHALAIANLPRHHKDPFDRILIAQAMTEGFTFITADKLITSYDGSILFVG